VVHVTTLAVQRDFFNLNVQQIPQGSGSGFIWDDKGHIITNYHVIENANAARVTLSDKNQTTVDATLIGADPNRDVAVLRINSRGLSLRPIPLGESARLRVGQKVFAIGNPFGLDQTLTTGVVSGLGREVSTGRGQTLRNLIQTDAAINPGNSGGPLLDSAGHLIGMNTAILSPSGAYAGIGFAIPSDEINLIVTTIINRAGQQKYRPSLGVELVSDHLAQRLRIGGVLFHRVDPNGPAAEAGLVPTRMTAGRRILICDVIVGIAGKRVTSTNDLMRVLADHQPGETVALTIVRGNEQLEVEVTLGKERE
jgi:S1-C subfamily serine protease